jgi:hypothetical protein
MITADHNLGKSVNSAMDRMMGAAAQTPGASAACMVPSFEPGRDCAAGLGRLIPFSLTPNALATLDISPRVVMPIGALANVLIAVSPGIGL